MSEIKEERVIAASGYFDPLHVGHIEYLKLAKSLGGKLIVIVNNDNQAVQKKGRFFMSEKERLEIIRSLKFVDDAILSIDNDRTVCKTLELLKPDIFAKGENVEVWNIPEAETCKKFNIMIANKLGEKIQSSSNLTGIRALEVRNKN